MVRGTLTPDRRKRLREEGISIFRDDGDYARAPSLELDAESEQEARLRLQRAMNGYGYDPDLFIAGPWAC